MPSILDEDLPRRIKIFMALRCNYKSGLFQKRVWASVYEICNIPEIGTDGNSKQIINEFISVGIIKKKEEGYVFDFGNAKKILENSKYMQMIKDMDFTVL